MPLLNLLTPLFINDYTYINISNMVVDCQNIDLITWYEVAAGGQQH